MEIEGTQKGEDGEKEDLDATIHIHRDVSLVCFDPGAPSNEIPLLGHPLAFRDWDAGLTVSTVGCGDQTSVRAHLVRRALVHHADDQMVVDIDSLPRPVRPQRLVIHEDGTMMEAADAAEETLVRLLCDADRVLVTHRPDTKTHMIPLVRMPAELGGL